MLKINPITKSINRYCLKNTINARYNRNMDMAMFSGAGLGVQFFRLPAWEIHDLGITSALATLALRGICEALKNRILLSPVIKRAKNIKKASV